MTKLAQNCEIIHSILALISFRVLSLFQLFVTFIHFILSFISSHHVFSSLLLRSLGVLLCIGSVQKWDLMRLISETQTKVPFSPCEGDSQCSKNGRVQSLTNSVSLLISHLLFKHIMFGS